MHQFLFISQLIVFLLWYDGFLQMSPIVMAIPLLILLFSLLAFNVFFLIWVVVVLIFLRRTERDLLLRSLAVVLTSLGFFSAVSTSVICCEIPKIRNTALVVALFFSFLRGFFMITCSDHLAILYRLFTSLRFTFMRFTSQYFSHQEVQRVPNFMYKKIVPKKPKIITAVVLHYRREKSPTPTI